MKTGSELRRDVERELEWEPTVDERQVGVSVIDGIVTLTGDVKSYSEKWRAERAVERVEETFKREATIDANRVTVQVNGSEVTLRGSVRSWVERHEAEKAAWAAPGVTAVHNYITVTAAA